MHRKNPLLEARCEILLLALKKQSPEHNLYQPTNKLTKKMMIYGNQQNKPKNYRIIKTIRKKDIHMIMIPIKLVIITQY